MMKTKARQDDEERSRWIGKKLSKLRGLKVAMTDGTTKVNHIGTGANSAGTSTQLRDEVVKTVLQGLLKVTSPSLVLNCTLVCKQWARVGKGVLQQANRFRRLPEEILVEIFERIKFSSGGTQEAITADIASCARTCQQWKRIASPLLYEHFVLNVNYHYTATKEYKFDPPFKLWWWQPFQIPTVASTWMHTLTVELHFNEAGAADRRITLIGFITSLPSLTTLSIRAAPLMQQHYISRAQLALIIDAIPPTVTNFELDTKGRDASSSLVRKDYLLCEALNKLLPQLRHLRLRMGIMCPLFITTSGTTADTKYPNLKSCTIFLLTRDLCRPAACCRPHQWSLENRPNDKLIARLSEKIDARCFPKLKRMIWAHPERITHAAGPVYGQGSLDGSVEVKRWSDATRLWAIEKFDIMETLSVESRYSFSRRNGPPADKARAGVNSLEAEEWIEGDAAWLSSANGARRPPK
ncbi:hypothetical protein EG327_004585 [Venturia inaequalis]|uniref:F-box domain-containing protein n=2 Tax=Venturia inaequalis TaxID=5025 RepID=A0A8H3Z579_VENIN|nr:hypothetical protein EG327_004585 [Venturia inaequalis]